jgi:DMSO reductase anchor subunit
VKPPLSVIFFTVLSGAGLGLFALLVMADLLSAGTVVSQRARITAGAAALALVAAGLGSSVLHLANPRNAWRALSQFRHSWLSREGIVALAFFPFAIAYLVALHFGASTGLRAVVGLPGVVLALGVLFCTGMIYACLKTIPHWHSWLTPANYLALGLASGALGLALVAALDRASVAALEWVAVFLFAGAAGLKVAYYLRARRVSGGHTLAAAVGMTAAQVKLLDVGHSHGTFLTREFVDRSARRYAGELRFVVGVAAFAIPVIVLSGALPSLAALAFACMSCLAGLLVERWLFFAEADHVVRLYHGQRSV